MVEMANGVGRPNIVPALLPISKRIRPQKLNLRRNPYVVKWNILFNKVNTQWMSFKQPTEGRLVYPCYACQDMFGLKSSYVDHVNRRGMLINFRCNQCDKVPSLVFYNPCAFLLHCRDHFSPSSGTIDLNSFNMSLLPPDLAGLIPHPAVPLIYNDEDDEINDDTTTVNTRFYSPLPTSKGNRIVIFSSNVLLFNNIVTVEGGNVAPVTLLLQGISSNVPRCKFVVMNSTNGFVAPLATLPPTSVESNNSNSGNDITAAVEDEVKDEPVSDSEETDTACGSLTTEHTDSAIERGPTKKPTAAAKTQITNRTKCSECGVTPPGRMIDHLVGGNRPVDDKLKCATCLYVAPTYCSLVAHKRIHLFMPPFVCPECGSLYHTDSELVHHLETVCFHMAKQVRYRCGGRNCNKIFAQSMTFASHFTTHMPNVFKCTQCAAVFFDELTFSVHSSSHEKYEPPSTFYKCTVCRDVSGGRIYTVKNYKQHIHTHCTDPTQRVYVYICKYCRSYFRSSQTYAVHLMRCTRRFEDQQKPPTVNKAVLQLQKPKSGGQKGAAGTAASRQASASAQSVSNAQATAVSSKAAAQRSPEKDTAGADAGNNIDDEVDTKRQKVRCIQCQQMCTLEGLMKHIPLCPAGNDSEAGPKIMGRKRGSKRPANSSPERSSAGKRQAPGSGSSVTSPEPPAPSPFEAPTAFTGTYTCRICDFQDTERKTFHAHIVNHRHVSSAYQCMECGECFLVKPSLIKHLRFYHQVADLDEYFTLNRCYDEDALSRQNGNADTNGGVIDDALEENQCRICREQFDDVEKLTKHSRVHGRHFIRNKNVSK